MTTKREILVSGGGISGPAVAYWLNRYGFSVTVVERAGGLRGGGYPIDVRGTALEAVRRMGIEPRLREVNVDMRRFTFLDAAGDEVAVLNPRLIDGGVEGRDLEVRRGDLADALFAATGGEVRFVFNDSIKTMTETKDGVEVTFASGARHTYWVVIGADGLHSRTREALFGPEEQFHRYLGYVFAGFTMPNVLGLSHEAVLWSTPGRAAVLYAPGDESDEVHGFLNFARKDPPFHAFRNPEAQRDLVAETFADAGWKVQDLVAAMRQADDLFFDTVSQIRMPRWWKGRVALVGDAAYAPSFLTGQGTSLALVGAYMLAGSLAAYPEPEAAFAAYERETREFVTLNQAFVDGGGSHIFPATAEEMERRDAMLRDLVEGPAPAERPAHSALTLPDFVPGAHLLGTAAGS
ncbi:FAD-dependent monooxygenase [Nonomuraea sp. NPDC049309]|uniref:FAD-dependent monooxygenase n=1 Tax=Nonomuraea sp. NPDC049309 TaxID=3364350 RepID=UPI003719BD13